MGQERLIFAPALRARSIFQPRVFWLSILAFIAYGMYASNAYGVNDLLDHDVDRRHPRKRARSLRRRCLRAPG